MNGTSRRLDASDVLVLVALVLLCTALGLGLSVVLGWLAAACAALATAAVGCAVLAWVSAR